MANVILGRYSVNTGGGQLLDPPEIYPYSTLDPTTGLNTRKGVVGSSEWTGTGMQTLSDTTGENKYLIPNPTGIKMDFTQGGIIECIRPKVIDYRVNLMHPVMNLEKWSMYPDKIPDDWVKIHYCWNPVRQLYMAFVPQAGTGESFWSYSPGYSTAFEFTGTSPGMSWEMTPPTIIRTGICNGIIPEKSSSGTWSWRVGRDADFKNPNGVVTEGLTELYKAIVQGQSTEIIPQSAWPSAAAQQIFMLTMSILPNNATTYGWNLSSWNAFQSSWKSATYSSKEFYNDGLDTDFPGA